MYFIIDVNKIQNCCRNKQNFAHGALSVHSCFHIKSNNITLEKTDNIKFIYIAYPV